MSNRRRPRGVRGEEWRETRHDVHEPGCGCVTRWLEFVETPTCPGCKDEPVPGYGLAMPISATPVGELVMIEVLCRCGVQYPLRAVVQVL
jgi:hypothetical protein